MLQALGREEELAQAVGVDVGAAGVQHLQLLHPGFALGRLAGEENGFL